jgi:hypothetical protein
MKGNETMTTYEFKIAIDGGAAFQETRVMTVTTERGWDEAAEYALGKLYSEFSDVVAFFNIVDWRRV